MAELTTNTRQPRVDMTPMVDLGFLLITFFVFTTTFSSNFMMKLNMPDNSNDPRPPIKYQNTLTLILGKDNRIFYHQKGPKDLNTSLLSETAYGTTLSKLILEKRNSAIEKDNFTVIIRPTDESVYKNTVDVLDEMKITNQPLYVLTDISPREVEVYQSKVKL
ncbi:biopolymer transporter ExbD [Emticicia sp. W12TSBA100-4]|uniref:ExbD/TolR family protein n=1 Tax=Emticicia sp. W12TSBA100-4 TaxID=3160965 RepID=UPI00330689B0